MALEFAKITYLVLFNFTLFASINSSTSSEKYTIWNLLHFVNYCFGMSLDKFMTGLYFIMWFVCCQVLDPEEITYESSIWGPTCDGLDCILKSVQLPEHEVGQWFYFEDMGAYTVAAASSFNGMQRPSHHYYCHQQLWSVCVL